MSDNVKDNVNDDKIKIEIPRSHAKKLGQLAQALYWLISDILDSHGITGSNRLDYFHFAERVLKIIIHKKAPLWAKAIEAEKSSYMILRNLNKDVLNDIERSLVSIFKDALREHKTIDFTTALFVIRMALTKKMLGIGTSVRKE